VAFQIVFRRDARTEFRQAARWYEERREGLGVRFTNAIDAELAKIRKNPLRFTPYYGDVRRTSVPVFPYMIYFRVDGNKIRVVSIFHTSRDPVVWQKRADDEQR